MRRSKWLVPTAALAVLLAACSGGGGAHHERVAGKPALVDTPGYRAVTIPPPAEPEPEVVDPPVINPRTDAPAPVTGPPKSRNLVVQSSGIVSVLTGPRSPTRLHESWNIAGTDLGFSFEMDGKTYIVFGDTWGKNGVEADDWRSNIMGIIDPGQGYVLTEMVTDANGQAKELLPSLKQPKKEYTVMPTSGIAVGDRMYLHYMSVRDWKRHWWGYKEPLVNGSGFAYSDDHGQTWIKDPVAWWPGDTAFTQTAMVEHDGYVYVFGTPADRFGEAKLLRAPGERLLEPESYEYWAGDRWSKAAEEAAPVVTWPVGEMSVRWSKYYGLWVMMYLNEIDHTIVLRTAQELTGPWSDEKVVVTDADFESLYAPYMLPIIGPDIYFTMSLFYGDYNVHLMRLTLEPAQ